MVHSPLVELSGVGGGSDPRLGVIAPTVTGGTRLAAVTEPAEGFRYAGLPLWPAVRSLREDKAASSFSKAR